MKGFCKAGHLSNDIRGSDGFVFLLIFMPAERTAGSFGSMKGWTGGGTVVGARPANAASETALFAKG